MAQNDVQITIVGNVVADPEIKYTNTGKAVVSFRVVSGTRKKQGDKWVDGEATFLTCEAWEQLAENIAATLRRGMRVIVHGNLKQRSYETKQGEKRTVYEVAVAEVGPSLRWATAQVTRNQRDGGNSGGGYRQQSALAGGPFDGGQGANTAPFPATEGEPPF